MFKRQCEQASPHEAHEWTKRWVKKNLPHLLHPEKYPDEWDARYKCYGVEAPIALGVDYLHEDCTPCEACADMAADRILKNHSESEVWREMGPGHVVTHMAEVTRL